VVPWKFAFRGDIATYRSRRRREREEEERRQELEKRLKEHEEKLTADIERRVATTVNEMAPTHGLPLVQVPSAHKSNCASGGSRRAKGNRRSSSGQPTVPCGWHLSAHQMWASQTIRQHQNEGMSNSHFYYLNNWSYILLWFLWTGIHNANNN
jgi:hypothetical protein